MPRFSEHARASYETPQLRRLAITALLILWPDGLTLAQLGEMLNVEKPTRLAQDIARLTEQLPTVWQEDCPVGCDDEVCIHARLVLHNPRAIERTILEVATGVGFGQRKRRSKYDVASREPRIPQVDSSEIDVPTGTTA